MTRRLLRAVAVALATVAVYAGAEYVRFREFCARHDAWARVQREPAAVVLDGGIAVARAGDAIFTCETEHCFPFAQCHPDVGCYCAPATMKPDAVAAFLHARSCALDRLAPSIDDDAGACRHARCNDHIGP